MTMMRENSPSLDRSERLMKKTLLPVALAFLAVALPAFPDSARTIAPQLVGVDAVELYLSSGKLPGLDVGEVEREMRSVLENAGIRVQESAPVVLFAQITFQSLPASPEHTAFRTYLALSEDVEIHRGKRVETVYVDTWHTSEDLIEPTSRAGGAARQSMLGLLAYFLESATYTATVMEEQPAQAHE